MGIGVYYLGDERCAFSLWAPFLVDVAVKIVSPVEHILPMKRTEKGYWKVILDNHEMTPIRINHIFMGAYVSKAGQHQITFMFRPILTYVCLALAYALLLLCFIMLIIKTKRAK